MNMKKIIILATALLLSSCASIYMKQSSVTADTVIEAINRGESTYPEQISSVPFIFDGEIVITQSAISRIWTGLVHVGFTLENPVITSISPVISTDYSLFRSSWEMEVFFKNKIPENTYKVTIEGIEGEVLLLLNRVKSKEYSLIGLKADAK